MSTLPNELLFVIAALVGLGAVGGFVVVPFRAALPFAVLAAPFAGLLVLAFGASLAYNDLELSLKTGLLGTAALGVLATLGQLIYARVRPCWDALTVQILVALFVAAVITPLSVWATLWVGKPAIQTSLGSDHIGYSHMADWIIAHQPSERPRVDQSALYESWPAAMFTDPRFGTFSTLAAVAMLRGTSSLFAYDLASAIVVAVAILGVAAVFARSPLTLILLVIGLLTAHWYDYSRTGFLAKAIGFPAAFFVAGLFMHVCAPLRPGALVALGLLAAGTFSVYWAEAPGVYVGLLCAGLIAARSAFESCLSPRRPLPSLWGVWQHVVVLALFVVIGLVVRNLVAERPAWGISNKFLAGHIIALVNPAEGPRYATPPWEQMMLAAADIDQQAVPLAHLVVPSEVLFPALLFTGACWLVVAGLAWWRRDAVATALTFGPIVFLAFLAPNPSPSAQWTLYQVPGTFYPLALCAAAHLLDGAAAVPRGWRSALLAGGLGLLLLVNIGLRVPRFLGVAERFASPRVPSWLIFSPDELDRLAVTINRDTVLVDIDQPHLSYIALLELVGRRQVRAQWAPSSWRYVFGYRPWPRPPEPDRPAGLILRGKIPGIVVPEPPGTTTIFETRQYRLIRPPSP
jgi:hypothetical protein